VLLILSSNCPLYFVPATIDAISKEQFFYQKNSTNFPEILSASPSAIADLPTPASKNWIIFLSS
jgi:hypothetical protein